MNNNTELFPTVGNLNNYDYGNYSDDQDYGTDDKFFAGLTCREIIDILTELQPKVMTPLPTELFTAIAYIVIGLIGLIGNGLVLFVIFGGKETTKTVANIYIWNLALADLLFVLSLPFMSAQRLLFRWPFGDMMCKIIEAMKFQNYFSSVSFLTAMSLDRYFAVVHVVNSVKYRTSRNTFFVCSGIWIMSLLMTIPILMNIYIDPNGMCTLNFKSSSAWGFEDGMDDYGVEDLPKLEMSGEGSGLGAAYEGSGGEDDAECKKVMELMYGSESSMSYEDGNQDFGGFDGFMSTSILPNETLPYPCEHPNHQVFRAYVYFSFISGFAIPFLVMTLCYVLIIVKILKPTEMKTRSTQAERKRRKVTRMVIAMVMCFFFCWLPFHVFHLIKMRGIVLDMAYCNLVRDITFIFAFMNSCLNPILYTFLGHNFSERLQRSMTITLRSLSLSTFTKYTSNNNTTSRAETCKRTEPNIYETTERSKSKSASSYSKKAAATTAVSDVVSGDQVQQQLIEEAG